MCVLSWLITEIILRCTVSKTSKFDTGSNKWLLDHSLYLIPAFILTTVRGQLKCDGTRAETRIRFSAKRTSPFKSAGASVQSTAGSLGVRISGSNAGYTVFWGSAKGTGYPLHSPVPPSLPLPCVTVCHHISAGVYCLLPCYHKVKLHGIVT